MKIRVEIEVPNGEYCLGCDYCRYASSDLAICNLFGCMIQLYSLDRYPERCKECKQAEVQNEN